MQVKQPDTSKFSGISKPTLPSFKSVSLFTSRTIGPLRFHSKYDIDPAGFNDLFNLTGQLRLAPYGRLAPGIPAMTMDRNRYFMLGVILLCLGLQFRLIDSFVLNESSTRALHKVTKSQQADANGMATNVFMQAAPSPKKTLKPPRWLGFVLLTAGGIMTLHALVLPKSH